MCSCRVTSVIVTNVPLDILADDVGFAVCTLVALPRPARFLVYVSVYLRLPAVAISTGAEWWHEFVCIARFSRVVTLESSF